MCDNQQLKTPAAPNDEDLNENFFQYTFEIAADIILGIVLGTIVNTCANYIGRVFGLNRICILIVQFFFICIVLYFMKIDSRYLYHTWRGQTNYGIVFTAVFLASQKNMIKLFEDIYNEEENKIGIMK